MFGKSIASLLGLVAGACIALAGLGNLVLRSVSGTGFSGLSSSAETILLSLAMMVIGVLVIIIARPRLLWWGTKPMIAGFELIIIGLLVWFFLGGGILLAIGAVLAILSGLLFFLEAKPVRRWF